MSRDEFHDGVARYVRSLMVPLAIFAVGLLAWIVGVLAYHPQMLSLGAKLFGAGNADFIRPVAFVPVIAAGLIGSWISHRPVQKDKRVHCGYCGKFLAANHVRMIVAATGSCPYCGSRLFDPSPTLGDTKQQS